MKLKMGIWWLGISLLGRWRFTVLRCLPVVAIRAVVAGRKGGNSQRINVIQIGINQLDQTEYSISYLSHSVSLNNGLIVRMKKVKILVILNIVGTKQKALVLMTLLRKTMDGQHSRVILILIIGVLMILKSNIMVNGIIYQYQNLHLSGV